jgi:hypothetical protein
MRFHKIPLFIAIAVLLYVCSSPLYGEEPQMIYQPGGMWMPHQIAETHADTLKKMGLEIDPKVFADPLQFPINAIVHLRRLSALVISSEGLVITNYHCVQHYLQFTLHGGKEPARNRVLAHDPGKKSSAPHRPRVQHHRCLRYTPSACSKAPPTSRTIWSVIRS